MLKEHPSQPWPPSECGPGDREQQRQVNSGCLVGGTYFIRMTVPPDVRGQPPVTVPPLEDVRRMLQELEAEDGARQSGTVDRLGRHPTFQFEEMD